MRWLGAILIGAAASVAASTATARADQFYVARCADSVYQAPASLPPKTYAALRLGPVVFNHLARGARHNVSPPSTSLRFYSVESFFNVLTSARRGVTIRLLGDSTAARLSTNRIGASRSARAIRFPLCRDSVTTVPLITQYGISFLLGRPGCFTVEVQPVGTSQRFRATIPVRVPHC